jgi:hypothetical protein
MKKLRQILSFVFASMVFISSSSFSFGMHHCGGEVRDVAFLSAADGCGHAQLPPCHKKLMAGCCSDETVSYAGQGFDISHFSFVADNVGVFVQPSILIDEIISVHQAIRNVFAFYDPILRSPDHVIINQVFRI